MTRNYVGIVAMGLMVPVGIMIAGYADSPAVFWLAVTFSVIGGLGVVLLIYRMNAEFKTESRKGRGEK